MSTASPLPVRADFDVPIPERLVPAIDLLVGLDYSAVAIEAVVGHLARHKTAEACHWIDPEHRAMVEAELDRDPAWNSAEWDESIYRSVD